MVSMETTGILQDVFPMHPTKHHLQSSNTLGWLELHNQLSYCGSTYYYNTTIFFFSVVCTKLHWRKMHSNLYTFLQLCSCVCSDYTHWQIIITSMCFGAFDRLYFRRDSANWPNILLHIIRSVTVLCHIILITRKCRTLWGKPEKADTGYYVTDEWCNTSSQSSSYMHIRLPFTGGFKSVFTLL